jgi:hypothetical protein
MRIRTMKAFKVIYQAYDANNDMNYSDTITLLAYSKKNFKEEVMKEIEIWNHTLLKIFQVKKVSEIRIDAEESERKQWAEKMIYS